MQTTNWRVHISRRISLHGVRNLLESSTIQSKFFWITLLLTSFSLLVFAMYRNATQFVNNPILSTFSVNSNDQEMDFPNIYICPMSPVSSKKVRNTSLRNLAHDYLDTANDDSILGRKARIWDTSERFPLNYCFIEIFSPPRWSAVFGKVGFEVEELFVSCEFDGKKRNCSEMISPKFDKDYGLCYLANVSEKQKLAGKGMRLAVDSNKNNTAFSHILNGFSVLINKVHDPTLTAGQYIYLSAGMYTKISLKAVKMNLVNFKNLNSDVRQKCVKEKESQFEILHNLSYSSSACRMECILRFVYKLCNCMLPLDDPYLNTEIRECTVIDIKNCFLLKVVKVYESEISNCTSHCWPPCESWKYVPTLTTIKLGENERDWVVLDVALESLQYSQVTQTIAQTTETFMSKLGGQLNLWLGASVLTVIQVLGISARYFYTKIFDKK